MCSGVQAMEGARFQVQNLPLLVRRCGKEKLKKGLRRGQDCVGTNESKEGGTMAALGSSFRGVNKKLM